MPQPQTLDPKALALLQQYRRPTESLSDVVVRLAQERAPRPLPEDDYSAVC